MLPYFDPREDIVIAEWLFSQQEPWRGRFLALVSSLAAERKTDRYTPDLDEIVAWFRTDPELRRFVKALLRAWDSDCDRR